MVEEAVLAAPLTATVLRPGGFAAMTLGRAASIRAGRPVEQAYPNARLDVIHPEDIADVAELALTTDALEAETISLGGPHALSFRDRTRILAELLDHDIELREVTREQAAAQLTGHVPEPFVEAVLDYWAHTTDESVQAPRSAERITARPARTFHQWAAESLAAFR
ncbi:hypothetical protein KGQ20_17085 [Catenulispora sp. NF23]|uniref:NmrA family protein n=1 Tax=Catenulispora pinistramenti TaxID=2705254 RepID=A0ABS5KXV2_9ACTN|nr:hypothetical protein [Catenulispora pinistramenti]MBS2534488.1 hypothetical protein [Catenulispora pinistramenti]MBS2550888.1 hypothetical protein [Catenulispora pinistramenti]